MPIPPPPADPRDLAPAQGQWTNIPPPPADPSMLKSASPIPSIFRRFALGLTTNEPTDSIFMGIPAIIGRQLPAAIGGIAGGALGAMESLGMGAIPAETRGAALGEAARQGLVKLMNPAETDLKQAAENVALQGVGQAAGSGIVKGLGAAGAGLYKTLGQTLGGVSPQAIETIAEHPGIVLPGTLQELGAKYAPLEKAEALGKASKGFMGEAKAAYQAAKESEMGKGVLNISEAMKAPIEAAKSGAGFDMPDLTETFSPGEAAQFNKISSHILDKYSNASPKEAWALQQKLGEAAFNAPQGTAIKKALTQLDATLGDYLKGRMPGLAPANATFSAAANLDQPIQQIVKSNNPAMAIATNLNKGTRLGRAIEEAAQKSPAVQQALEDFKIAKAAREVLPMRPSLPRTGLTGALGIGAAEAMGNATGAEGGAAARGAEELGPAAGFFMSPRLVGYGAALAGSPLGKAVGQTTNAIAPRALAQGFSGMANSVPDQQFAQRLLSANQLNPDKSGAYKKQINALGLPKNMVSPSGKASLSSIAQKLFDAGKIQDNDEDSALQWLKQAAIK